MTTLEKRTPEVYQAIGDGAAQVVSLNEDAFHFVSSAMPQSARKRCRILCHENTESKLHEMMVCYGYETYVRPNRHPHDESIFLVFGECDVAFFDDAGGLTHAWRLSARGTRFPYYCRLPRGIFHTVLMRGTTLLYEVVSGPFLPGNNEYAGFAPEENRPEVAVYQQRLRQRVSAALQPPSFHPMALLELGPNVMVAQDRKVRFAQPEEDLLKSRLMLEQLERVRICAHPDDKDPCHEMLMLFRKTSYIRPSKHINKEEALYVLEGLGTYLFFDDSGKVIQTVPVGPAGSGRAVYCRVPANSWHALVQETDMLVKESCQGPFRKEDTVFPSWAPAEPGEYLDGLRRRIKG